VAAEVAARVTEGHKEVVLTGTRIGSYDHDGGIRGLTARVLNECDVRRLRLSSLEPADVTPGLLRLWEDPRLCPHIHMPLQSGSDSVLERMGRAYSTVEYERAVLAARDAIPDLAITTDIMVGFPGESEAEFNESRFRSLFLGRTASVLWEGAKEGVSFGHTDNYIRVFLSGGTPPANEFVATRLAALGEGGLWGTI
jgi:threonylcarbamoyladenosine tRNA methylthiotransferase MtaB